jgi:hypothetical protein
MIRISSRAFCHTLNEPDVSEVVFRVLRQRGRMNRAVSMSLFNRTATLFRILSRSTKNLHSNDNVGGVVQFIAFLHAAKTNNSERFVWEKFRKKICRSHRVGVARPKNGTPTLDLTFSLDRVSANWASGAPARDGAMRRLAMHRDGMAEEDDCTSAAFAESVFQSLLGK